MSVVVYACADCGHACFPARLLCHRCGAGTWRDVVVGGGEVVEITQVHHQADATAAGTVFLAAVQTEAGVILLARLDTEVERGSMIELGVSESGAIINLPGSTRPA